MEQIRSSVDDAAQKMRELAESSKRIGNIVEVIRQISEQTSMLALNASIEAAHAGEQGRGFAVVADEVSSLARRVGQSAKDIEALIQTIKEQTQAAITSMEHGTREVGNGSALVTATLTGLGQLITVVKDTATAVHDSDGQVLGEAGVLQAVVHHDDGGRRQPGLGFQHPRAGWGDGVLGAVGKYELLDPLGDGGFGAGMIIGPPE